MIQRKSIQFENQALSYLDNENNKPISIFFVHANGYSGGCYRYYLKQFGKNYRVLAIDLMNHGSSGSDINFTDWSSYAKQILKVLMHERLDHVIGIGHSMGASILVRAAYQIPQRFIQLIGLDPVFLGRAIVLFSRLFGNPLSWKAIHRRKLFKSQKMLKSIFERHPFTKRWNTEIIKDYIDSCYKKVKEGMVLCCAPEIESKNFRTPSYNTIRQARSLTIPFHLILPQKSKVCSEGMAKKVTAKRANSEIILKSGLGHHFPFEEPEWTARSIRRFLKV